ncbi:unnamed protein product [Phytomonas sp. Hart1]|eukprot:CCW68618.1 unnamed protein product [Phytomonas sp. isolate Hart1]
MLIPTTLSIGDATWSQSEDNESVLEIQIPNIVPTNARPRDLCVEIKDSAVLCISHAGKRLLQWRLHSAVNNEVEWRVDNAVVVLDLEKKVPTVWSCLLDLPLSEDDSLLTPLDEINRMFTQYFPMLPPVVDDESEPMAAEKVKDEPQEIKENKGDDDDLDKLLQEAADEIVMDKKDETDTYSAFVRAELENYKREEEEVKKKRAELDVQANDPSDPAVAQVSKDQVKILDKILFLHNECRKLRSQPVSLENFIQCTKLDLQKARVNIGETGESENEEYKTEEEKSLSAADLIKCGLHFLEDKDVKTCLHYLRLAAIHHQSDQATMLLYNIYSQLESPRGSSLLLNRALDDTNPSASANQKLGELYDKGERHFLPLFPAALYFFERAAKLGSVSAMLSLSQLWLRGSTESTLASETEIDLQKDIPKYHAWLKKAIDRGCGSAYFVKGCMHIKGENGVEKSYEKAKHYITIASRAQPELSKRAVQLPAMLEQLRKEEEEAAGKTSKTNLNRLSQNVEEEDSLQVTPSVARLNMLTKAAPSEVAGAPIRRFKKSFGGSASRRLFWEKTCMMGTVAYGVYSLAFPLRVMILPFVYSILGSIVEVVPWLANQNADTSLF